MFKEKIKKFGIGDSSILDLIQKNFKIEDDVPSQSRTISEKDYSTIKILVYHKSNDIYVISNDHVKQYRVFYSHHEHVKDNSVLDIVPWSSQDEIMENVKGLIGTPTKVTVAES